MATDKLRVDIETVDRASAGLGAIDKRLLALTASYVAFNAVASVANSAIRLLGDQMTRGVALAANYEKAAFQLTKAQELLGVTNRGVTRDLLKFAEGLQLATQFTDDDIVPAMVALTNIAGVTGEELKNLTKLTLDVAVTFNRNLNDAAVLVGKSARGVTDRMNELGLSIDDNIKGAAERGAAALDLLRSRSDGAAIAVGETLVGAVAQMGSAWDTVLRQFGEAITTSDALRTTIRGVTEALTGFSQDMERINLDPIIRQVAIGLTDVALATLDLGQAMSRALPDLTTFLGLMKIASGDAIGGAATLAQSFGEEILGLQEKVEQTRRALLNIAGPFGALEAHAREAADPIRNEQTAVDGLRLSLERLRKTLQAGPVLGPELPPGYGTQSPPGLVGGAPDEITKIRIEGYDALQRAIEEAGDREIAMWNRLRQQAQQGIEPWVEFENTMAGIAEQQITVEQNNQQMILSMEDLANEAAYFGANVVAAGIEGRLEIGRMIRSALAGLAAMVVRAALFRAILAGASGGAGGASTSVFTAIAGGALASGGAGTTVPINPTVATLDPVSPLTGAPVGVNLAIALMQPSDSLVSDVMNTMSRLARTHGATISKEVVGV